MGLKLDIDVYYKLDIEHYTKGNKSDRIGVCLEQRDLLNTRLLTLGDI
jgi:hypothetical protein